MTDLEVGLGITSTCQRNDDQTQCHWNRNGTKLALHMVPEAIKTKLSYVPYGEINNYDLRADRLLFHCAGIKHGGPTLRTTERCIHYFMRKLSWRKLLSCDEIHKSKPPPQKREILPRKETRRKVSCRPIVDPYRCRKNNCKWHAAQCWSEVELNEHLQAKSKTRLSVKNS